MGSIQDKKLKRFEFKPRDINPDHLGICCGTCDVQSHGNFEMEKCEEASYMKVDKFLVTASPKVAIHKSLDQVSPRKGAIHESWDRKPPDRSRDKLSSKKHETSKYESKSKEN